MGNYEQLKQSVSDVIKTNGNQEITGSILQNVLLTIISTVGANATFAGIATPAANPGTPDGPVFYLASESGTYSNFNAIELQDGLSVLMWNGSWSSQQIFSVDDEPIVLSENLVKGKGVYDANLANKEGVQKGTYGLILDTDNILINQGKNFIEKDIIYSQSLRKFDVIEGQGCIRFVEVLPTTTYYIMNIASVIEFNSDKEYITHHYTNIYQQSEITTTENTNYLVLNYGNLNPTYIYAGTVPYTNISNFKNNVKNQYLLLTEENFRGYSSPYGKVVSDVNQVIYRTLSYNLKQGYYFNNEGNEIPSVQFSRSMIFDVELLKNYDLLIKEVNTYYAHVVYTFGISFEKLGYYGPDGENTMLYLTYDELITSYPTAKYFVVNCRGTDTYPFIAISKGSFRKHVTETGQTQLAIKAGDTLLFNVKRGDSMRVAIFGRPTLGADAGRVTFYNGISYDGQFIYTAKQDFNEIRVILENNTTGSVDIIFDKSVGELLSVVSEETIPIINDDVPSILRFEELIRSIGWNKQLSTPIVNHPIEGNAMASMAAKLYYHNGAIYGWKMANDVPDDHPETKSIYLFKYIISSEQLSVVEVLKPEQVLTFTDNTTATVKRGLEGNIIILNSSLLLVNTIYDTNNDSYVIRQEYDLSLNLVSTSKCIYTKDGATKDFSVDALKESGLAPFPNTFSIPTIITFNCGFAEKDGRYYGVLKVEEHFQYVEESTNPIIIFSTTDFINWQFEYIIKEKGNGEVAIDINNDVMTLCIRPHELDKSNLQLVEKINMNDWSVVQRVYITGCRSMSTFFRYNNKLYLLSPGSDFYGNSAIGRRNYKISYIDESDLRNSCKICDTSGYAVGANTNIVEDTNHNMYIAGTSANIVLCRFTMPLQDYRPFIYNFINSTFLT